MTALLTIGIDPGLDGALAFYDGLNLAVIDMPTFEIVRGGKKKREVDAAELARNLGVWSKARQPHAYVEQVGAMPGQGVTGMFSFGQSYGIVLGVLAALEIPYTRVVPTVWKKAMGLRVGKDAERSRASELLPAHTGLWPLKKHDGRAESALLALHGARQLDRVAA